MNEPAPGFNEWRAAAIYEMQEIARRRADIEQKWIDIQIQVLELEFIWESGD